MDYKREIAIILAVLIIGGIVGALCLEFLFIPYVYPLLDHEWWLFIHFTILISFVFGSIILMGLHIDAMK